MPDTPKLSERLDALAQSYVNAGHHGTIETLREAAELARRVEGAAVAEVTELFPSLRRHGVRVHAHLPADTFNPGQRVRIVAEDGNG